MGSPSLAAADGEFSGASAGHPEMKCPDGYDFGRSRRPPSCRLGLDVIAYGNGNGGQTARVQRDDRKSVR